MPKDCALCVERVIIENNALRKQIAESKEIRGKQEQALSVIFQELRGYRQRDADNDKLLERLLSALKREEANDA